jgi:hypothetical protein
MIIDLGCGNAKRGDIGIDIEGPPKSHADIVCNLGFEKIPLEDNFADRVVAHHFVEHIPDAVYLFNQHDQYVANIGTYEMELKNKGWHTHRPHIFLFNEVYRILKNRGIFYVQVPIVTDGRGMVHQQAFQDPQHVSYWTPERFRYFSGDYYSHRELYGHTSRFELVSIGTGCGHGWPWCLEAELRAIKDLPEDHPYQLSY